jgi:hypothetical protein
MADKGLTVWLLLSETIYTSVRGNKPTFSASEPPF